MTGRTLRVIGAILAVLAVWVTASAGARAACQHAPAAGSRAESVLSGRASQALAQEDMMRCAPPCRSCAPSQRSVCCASALLAAAGAVSLPPRYDRDPLRHMAERAASLIIAPPYRPPNIPSKT
jgi:hypothetical protein